MSEYHEALSKCADRYRAMTPPGDSLSGFVDEFQSEVMRQMPVPKLCRWLGYIQGVLIARGITTVEAEREWTRPLFRPLDFPERQ